MELDDIKPEDWHNVRTFMELADAIHELTMKEYAESEYAELHRQAA
jgi:hypothetical protein